MSDGQRRESPPFILASVEHIAQIADLVKAARAVLDYEWSSSIIPTNQPIWLEFQRQVEAAEGPATQRQSTETKGE